MLAEVQDGGAVDVSRFLFCSRSFFTVGRVQHGFSFGADETEYVQPPVRLHEVGQTSRSVKIPTKKNPKNPDLMVI